MSFEKRTRKEWWKQTRNRRKNERRKKKKEKRRVKSLFLLLIFSLVIVSAFSLAVRQDLAVGVSYARQLCLVEPNIGSITVTVTPEYILLAEHSIDNSNSSEDRNWNMKLVADIINQEVAIIMPGETFSYLETVGDTTPEKGFRKAGVIVHGKPSYDYGGGVCQVTSTLNSVMIKAGIETHASVHSLPSRYIVPERGDREAAVSFKSKTDFSFKNTTPNPIKIHVNVEGGTVTVQIFKIEYEIKIKYRKN